MLASYLSPDVASSIKALVLPSKPMKTTLVLVGKGYTAAGQAGVCLHIMAVYEYQADLLKEDSVSQLRRTTDLALRATKETTRMTGQSMAALAAVERHFWLTLSDLKEKGRVFLPLLRLLVCSATTDTRRLVNKWQHSSSFSLASL